MKIYWTFLGLKKTIFSIFGTKTRDFKTYDKAFTHVKNILLVTVFKIENQLVKSSWNKPSPIFIENNNSSLPESLVLGPIFYGEFLKRLNSATFYAWTPPFS